VPSWHNSHQTTNMAKDLNPGSDVTATVQNTREVEMHSSFWFGAHSISVFKIVLKWQNERFLPHGTLRPGPPCTSTASPGRAHCPPTGSRRYPPSPPPRACHTTDIFQLYFNSNSMNFKEDSLSSIEYCYTFSPHSSKILVYR